MKKGKHMIQRGLRQVANQAEFLDQHEAVPSARPSRNLAKWLLAVALMVMLMAIIGAITRLTESGLSMVNWRPVMEAIPPMSEAVWNDEFSAYKQTPEYIQKNAGMTLQEFKKIYWWEWIHRQWGRLIGVAFVVPWILLTISGGVPLRWQPRLAVAFGLGGLQGWLGWWMVQSGLVDDPFVAPYRLMIHLLLASIIFAYLIDLALQADDEARGVQTIRIDTHTYTYLATKVLAVLLFFVMASGALMAGSDAGLAYDTYPLMDGELVPSGYGLLEPWWHNLFANATAIHFNHRALTALWLIAVCAWVLLTPKELFGKRYRVARAAILHTTALQFLLGITLVLRGVPIPEAATHQLLAFVLVGALTTVAYAQRRAIC